MASDSGAHVDAVASSGDAIVADGAMTRGADTEQVRWPSELQPPNVVIEEPLDETTLSEGSVQVVGSVSDNVAVAAATIQVGPNVPVPLALQPDGRFSTEIQLGAGKQLIVVAARDVAGNTGERSVTVTWDTKKPDLAPPTLLVIKPQAGFSIFSDTIRIEGKASDDVGVAEVRARVGQGALQLAKTQDNFATFWLDLSIAAGGSQQVTVIARDVVGKTTTATITGSSQKVFDNTPPTVKFDAPTDGFATANDTVIVHGQAGDAAGVAAVELRVGTGPYQPVQDLAKGANSPFSSFSAVAKLQPGTNLLKLRARDHSGLVSFAQIAVKDTSGSQWSKPLVMTLRHKQAAKKELSLTLDRAGLSQLLPADKADKIVMMKLDIQPLVESAFKIIRNACGSGWQKPNNLVNNCPKAWGQPERNLWRLLTMTPANANVEGTSIASMASIAEGLSKYNLLESFDKILAAALGIGTKSLVVGEKAVAEAMLTNLIKTHPNVLPDGRLPVTMHDAMTDLKSLGAKFDKTGQHPGFLAKSAPPHSVIMTKSFQITMTAVSNLAWHDGARLSGAAPMKSYVALVSDTIGPTYDDVLEFEFQKPGKFVVKGLAAKPTTSMTIHVGEDAGWHKTGTSMMPLPKGSGEAWKVKPWLLERILVEASYLQYKNLRRGCSYCKSAGSGALLYESLFGLDVAEIVVGRQGYRKGGSGGPEHFAAISPNPAGWLRIWTLLGIGSPPKPQYAWDMITEVSQRRLLDGGVKQGQGDVRFALKDVPVGITSADIKAALVPQMQAQKSKLSALLMGKQNNNEAIDFYLARGADKELRLYFVAASDPVPAATNQHTKRGFFADAKLTQKLSSTADGGSGDKIHEKLAVGDGPKVVYVQNTAAVVHRIAIEEVAGDEVTLTVRRFIGAGAP